MEGEERTVATNADAIDGVITHKAGAVGDVL